MTSRQLAAFAFLAVAWGSSFLFIRVLVTHGLTPVGVSFSRTSLGLAVLLPLAWRLRHTFPRDRRTWAMLAALGAVNFAVPWTLFGLGARYVPSGVGTIANASNPLWAGVLALAFVPAERISPARVAGLVAGFFGVAVLMQERVDGFDRESMLGIPPMLLATLCYAVSALAIRRWLAHVPALALTIGQVSCATVFLAPAVLATGAFGGIVFGWREWASLIALGCVGSGLAVVAYMQLIREMGAVRASVVTYLMPPVGVFLGWLLLSEPLTWSMAAGSTLILGGVALVQFGLPFPGAGRRPARVIPPAP